MACDMMVKGNEINNDEKLLQHKIDVIASEPRYSDFNKKKIKEFVRERKVRYQNKPYTILKDLIALKALMDYWVKDKDFDKVTKENLMRAVEGMEEKGWSPQTQKSFKCAIKIFWRFLYKVDDVRQYPKQVSWISTTVKRKVMLLPKHILTRDEIERMSKVADNFQRAILWVGYCSAARPMELLNMRISDITFTSYGCDILLRGCKGERCVPIIEGTEPLRNWLRQHPLRNDDDYCVWVTKYSKVEEGKTEGEGGKKVWSRLSNSGANRIIKLLADKAGVKKDKICLYSLRKSRATELAGDSAIPIHVLHKFMGWSVGSDISRHYVALSQRNIKESILKSYGLDDELDNNHEVKFIECFFCKKRNPPSNLFCDNCSKPLIIRGGEIDLRKNIDKLVTEKMIEMLMKFGFKVEESDDKDNYQISKDGELYMEMGSNSK
jgi:integrase